MTSARHCWLLHQDRRRENTGLPAEISDLKSTIQQGSASFSWPPGPARGATCLPEATWNPPPRCCLHPSACQAPPCSDPWARWTLPAPCPPTPGHAAGPGVGWGGISCIRTVGGAPSPYPLGLGHTAHPGDRPGFSSGGPATRTATGRPHVGTEHRPE